MDNMLRVAKKVQVADNEVLPVRQSTFKSLASIQLMTQPIPTRGATMNLARIVRDITNGVISQLFEGRYNTCA